MPSFFVSFYSVTLAILLISSMWRPSTALEVVQAQVPLRKSYEDAACQQTIVQHIFASSYGVPYVGELRSSQTSVLRGCSNIKIGSYSPPEGCVFTTPFSISL